MPSFAYTARDRAGKSVSSTLQAPSRKDALRILTARGLQTSTIEESIGAAPSDLSGGVPQRGTKTEAPRSGAKEGAKPRKGKAPSSIPATSATTSTLKGATAPRRSERLSFLEALHELVGSGLSAGEAVRLLSIRIKEPRLRALCGGLWERISEGAPLSRAMGDFPEVFDSATVNLVHAGEATGSLNDTVARLIAHLTEQKELRRQLLTALAYPVFMVFVAFGVILFFLFVLLPRLQSLLSSLGGKMPLSTKILIGIANFSLHYGVFVVLAAAFAAVSVWRWYSTPGGRLTIDRWLLKLPLIGPFLVAQTVQSFSQTLNVLLENGITMVEALRMTERQIGNRVHQQAFNEATARVLEGESLSATLTRTGCFPDLVLDRLAVGQDTGNVVSSLKEISKTYQKIITNRLSAFTSILASVVLMGVFIFVGFIAFAIVSAVFSVSSSFKM